MDDTPTPIAEIDHGPSKFEAFLDENQKIIVASAVAIFLAVIGYVGYTGYSDILNAQAGEALSSANDDTQLQAVISNHSTSASAAAATLLIANNKGSESPEEAIAALRDFTTSYPNHPAIPTATTSLGLRLLNQGKLSDAEAQLNTVLDMENAEYIIPAAQIGLGDIAQKNGNSEQAKELYTAVTNLISDNTSETNDNINKFAGYKTIASNRIRFINTTPPNELEKKVAPTPPATSSPAPAPEEKSTTSEKDEKKSQDAE